jgi:serine/threonine protein kinase/formylglycine-generating enzyme required for sulfatase activity
MHRTECPSLDDLWASLEGRLAPEWSDHIEACTECQSRLNSLADSTDGMSSLLRAAGPCGSATTDPAFRDALARLQGDATSAAPGHGPTPGQRIGEYRLEQPLGAGGMGTVWRAVHTRLDKPVAIKLLSRRLMAQPNAVTRFAREMKAVGRLTHPHIVEALDAGEWDGIPYLVMEHIVGIDLSQLVHGRGPMSTADACEAARQAALALQHAHGLGLIHRDVKPSNLILSADGTVRLLDLGLARLPDAGPEPAPDRTDRATNCGAADLTETDMVVGTGAYMAPEQQHDPRAVDARADLYALGRTLSFLLSGSPDPPPAGALPPGLVRIVGRLQAHRPDDRFPTAAQAIAALTPWARGHDLRGILGPRRQRSPKRVAMMLAAMALLFVLTGVGLTAYFLRGDDTPPTPAAKEAPRLGEIGQTSDEAKALQREWADYLGQEPVVENSVGMKLALVPPGEINLSQATRVRINRPYRLGTTEVTRGQFQRFVDSTGYRTEVEIKKSGQYQVFVKTKPNAGGTRSRKDPNYAWHNPGYPEVSDNHPVTQVSWNDANAYCQWLGEVDGHAYRLPTRAEAEWAARAGESGNYPRQHPDGDLTRSLEEFAWTYVSSPRQPQRVAQLMANPWGLHDMIGNVQEWARDWWGEPPAGTLADYAGPPAGTLRSLAGGAYTLRAPYGWHSALHPDWGSSSIGFRVLREP